MPAPAISAVPAVKAADPVPGNGQQGPPAVALDVDEVAAGPKTRKRRPLVILAVVTVLAIAALGTYAVLTAGEENTDDAQVYSDLVPIGARVSGQAARVLIQEDQAVKKGDLLIEIDDRDYVARVQQAQAELDTAKAQADTATAQVQIVEANSRGGLVSAQASVSGSATAVTGAEAQVAAAQAQLLRAQSDAEKAALDLGRARDLRRGGAASQQFLDNAQSTYASEQAALMQARANLSAAQEAKEQARSRVVEARGRLSQSQPIDAQIAAARAQARLAEARVKADEAALELARLQLSYTKITAPADGVASKLAVHEGALVSAGQSLIDLVPATTYVLANFKETQVGRMLPGQRAEVEIDAYPHHKFAAEVASLAGGTGSSFSLMPADNASGNFVKVVQRVPVRLKWSSPPPGNVTLRAGMSADVTVKVR